MAENINIKISVQGNDAEKSLKRVSKAFSNFGNNAEKSTKKVSSAFSTFKGVLGANLVTSALQRVAGAFVDFGKTAISEAANIEKITTGFTTLLGSAEKAGDMVKDLQQFAATTPFQLPGITASAQKLLAFGFAADSITDKLQKIGDVTAGSNANLSEVTLVYGKVAAAGKLTGETLLQFQERAIPIGPAIAKTMGIAENAVKDTVSKGKVSLAVFEKAFASLSQEGGMFYEGMVRQSKTLGGVLSTLQDNFSLVASEVGVAFLPAIKSAAIGVIELLQSIQKLVGEGSKVRRLFTGMFGDDQAVAIQKIDVRMESLNVGVARLQASLKAAQSDDKGFFGKLFGDARSAEQIQIQLDKNLSTIRELQAERDKITAKAGEDTAKQVAAEQEKFNFLNAIREEQKLKEEEDKLAAQVAADETNIVALEALRNNLAEQQALKETFGKKDIDLQTRIEKEKQTNAKKTEDESKKSLASLFSFEKNTNAGRAANFKSTLGTIATLSSSNNKTLFAIGKAAALSQGTIDGIAATQRALASAPPPFNFALAALVGVASAANLAKIASAKPPGYAEGGIVGGNIGATAGSDNRTIQARDGEMFLNAEEQSNLFNGIKSGNLGGGGDIVIQIDGREIARAVREQQNQGFALMPIGV